jgi:cytochrome c-type biogenesis protein CcmE
MDPARKRTIRLTVALTAAVLLAMALLWTSFNASSEAKTPSELLAAAPTATESYKLTGKVAEGSWKHEGNVHEFRVRDRDGTATVPVRYVGPVPDPFREGREIAVTVRREGDVYVGERDSLVTKCPSKFVEESEAK